VGELAKRRTQTVDRVQLIREKLKPSEQIVKSKACVYATGSFGRGEASRHSDLDLFIVGKTLEKADKQKVSQLSHLDEICLMGDLIKVTRELSIPDFSGDGEWLKHYAVHELTGTLGTREDDVTNTFTARLLLLLESSWLVEEAVYNDIIEVVVGAYWRDYGDNQSNFVPAFLANDILRLWRTFCVNYESGTERYPEDKRAKGKLKNYKLKHSRLLTCYSALLYLLAIYKLSGTVSPLDAIQMSKFTPTGRIEWILEQKKFANAHSALRSLLHQYEQFLETTDAPEQELIERFKTKETAARYRDSAFKLGDFMLEALQSVGGDSHLYRLFVI
jgi:predicted nucleotidyltransferase